MKKTKILGASILVGLAALSLTACSDEVSDPSKTIMFYNTCGDKLAGNIDTVIEKFEEKYPGWTVTNSQVGGYDECYNAIVSDLQANTTPDLAYCYSDHVAYYLSSGKVMNLSKYLNDTVSTVSFTNGDGEKVDLEDVVGYTAAEKATFVQSYFNEGLASNFAGSSEAGFAATDMITLPFSKSTELMYYNADALKDLGLEVPTTWDELWEACEIVKESYPNSTPLAYDSEANWFITACEQNGWDYTSAEGTHYNFNNTNTQNWLTSIKAKYDAGLVTTQTVYGSYTSGLFTKGVETGCTFCIGSSGGASYQATKEFKWGVAPIPGTTTGSTVNSSVISQGPSLVMFDNGNDEKALLTWEFMQMLLEPKFQATFSMASGYNPVRTTTYAIEEYQDFLDDETSIIAAAASTGKELADKNSFFTSPAFRGSSTARVQVGSALVYTLNGAKSSERALADAVKNCGN
jgi:multiple sugar transport system substrate-binding protein